MMRPTFTIAALVIALATCAPQGMPVTEADGGQGDAGSIARCITQPLLISGIQFGGYGRDYVELHNQSRTPVPLGGWMLSWDTYMAAGALPLDSTVTLPPGGYFLVAADGGDQALPVELDTIFGWVGIGQGIGPGCSRVTADWFGWGQNGCARLVNVAPEAFRRLDSCTDTDQARDWSEWHEPLGPARRLTTAPETCPCQ